MPSSHPDLTHAFLSQYWSPLPACPCLGTDLKPLGGIPLIVEHLLYRNQASGSAGGSSDSSSSGGSDASAPTPPPPPPPSLASPLPPTPAARAATAQSKALAAEIRTAAAYVIGSAASNNVRFQADLLEAFPDIFDTLLEVRRGRDDSNAAGGEAYRCL